MMKGILLAVIIIIVFFILTQSEYKVYNGRLIFKNGISILKRNFKTYRDKRH